MILKAVPATSLFVAIRRVLRMEPPTIDAARLLPANATAATWDRERHPCQVCGEEMTLIPITLDGIPQYRCLPCDALVAEQAHKQLETIRSRTGKLPIGAINQIYRTIAPGTIARDAYHAQQQEAMDRAQRNIISALSTNKDLKEAPEVSELETLTPRHHTGPLPARDIEYAPTPRDVSSMPTLCPAPATPTPETHESLFADATDEGEDTEKVVAIRLPKKPKDTVEIRAMTAEMYLLEAMRHHPVHEQSTGENEQVTADAWLR